MKFNTMLLIPFCIALTGSIACADYVHIKYRSGHVQILRLDEPSSKIAGISYQEDNASVAEPSSSHPTKGGTTGQSGEAAAAPVQKDTGTNQTNGKQQIRIEWAPPVE